MMTNDEHAQLRIYLYSVERVINMYTDGSIKHTPARASTLFDLLETRDELKRRIETKERE